MYRLSFLFYFTFYYLLIYIFYRTTRGLSIENLFPVFSSFYYEIMILFVAFAYIQYLVFKIFANYNKRHMKRCLERRVESFRYGLLT